MNEDTSISRDSPEPSISSSDDERNGYPTDSTRSNSKVSLSNLKGHSQRTVQQSHDKLQEASKMLREVDITDGDDISDGGGATSTPSCSRSSSTLSTTNSIPYTPDDIRNISSIANQSNELEQSCSMVTTTNNDVMTYQRKALMESLVPEDITVPILGFEVMEQRAKFTVFKIEVNRSQHESWFIFRRYTDFVQLNDKLKVLFPGFRLALPPRRWFRDNFDKDFLDDRLLGLQAFLNNVTGHKDVYNSFPVCEFFCLADPPGPHDSLEESRALCESLEEALYNTRKEVHEKNTEIDLLNEEMALYKSQLEAMQRSVRINKTKRLRKTTKRSPAQHCNTSLAECDMAPQCEVGQNTDRVVLSDMKLDGNLTNQKLAHISVETK